MTVLKRVCPRLPTVHREPKGKGRYTLTAAGMKRLEKIGLDGGYRVRQMTEEEERAWKLLCQSIEEAERLARQGGSDGKES